VVTYQGRGKGMAAKPRDLRLQARTTKQGPRPTDDQPKQADDQRTNALLWLGLAEGPIRDALVERLAQAHLTELPAAAIRDRGPEVPGRS
jgi:hypothetical protein